MKIRTKKEADLETIKGVIADNLIVVMCSFQGIKVEEDFQLRKAVKGAGGGYRVVQNRLAKVAAEGTPFEQGLSGLQGMTSLAFAQDDPVSLIKALIAYAKDHPVFEFRAGVMDGRVLDVGQLNELTKLPSKEELYAKLLFLLNAPATQLVRVLNAPAQEMVGVLNAPGRDLTIVIDQAVKENKLSA